MSNAMTTRMLLLQVSKQISEREMEEMKFLYHKIPKGRAEKINSPLGLFREIAQYDEKGEDGVSDISQLLIGIGRKDLSNELLGIEVIDQKPQKQNTEKRCLLIVEKFMAPYWRQLGRHLGLETYILDEIEHDHRRARDQCAGVLEKWKKVNGVDMEALKKVLLDMQRRDILEKISRIEGGEVDKSEDTNPIIAQPEEDKDMQSVENVVGKRGNDSVEKDVYRIDKSTYSYSSGKPSGVSASKYNIQVHPGSNVMVGDCGTMTVFTNAKIDERVFKVGQHDVRQSLAEFNTAVKREPAKPKK